jgi:pullulanase/glycogen debranching enzyme
MHSPIYQTSIGDSLATLAGMGLMVMMDIVHSHAAPDEGNGLASFDGANDCYFYPG